MKRWFALLWLLAPGIAMAQAIPDTPAATLEPKGPWSVDYGTFSCTLVRDFVAGGKAAKFALTLEPITSTAWLRVATEGEAGKRDSGRATMLHDGQRVMSDLHYNFFGVKGGYGMREFMLDLNRHKPGDVKATLRFWTKRHGDIELSIRSFPAAWTALQACMDDLYKGFGINPQVLKEMATAPVGNYDTAAPWTGGEGEYAILFWVSANGTVDECRLLKPSGQLQFDKSVCADIMAKARYKPARNARGEAVRVPIYDHPVIRTTRLSR